MAVTLFNCCTCPEPPDYDEEVDGPLARYRSKCGCPTVALAHVSSYMEASMVGFPEFSGFESSPIKYYRSSAYSGECKVRSSSLYRTIFSGARVYDIDGNLIQDDYSGFSVEKSSSSSGAPCVAATSWSGVASQACHTILSGITKRLRREIFQFSAWHCLPTLAADTGGTVCSDTGLETLSVEDLEVDAINRETPVAGSSDTSAYDLRTTSKFFTYQTSTYTATANNLVVGVEYQGCVRIQRRQSYSGTHPPGADTNWYDVEPDTIAAFNATDKTMEIATDVALPLVRGYQYKVVSAHVWPTSAGCDCPTSYVAP